MESFAEKIRSKAFEVGFQKVGIAPATPLPVEAERLHAWLENGHHAAMSWMVREPEKRTDPRLIFPEARSVIALALNYYTPHEHDTDPSRGKISRYAWGDDYHDVVREKLILLLDWIKAEVPGADGKACVDTAPIMDKAWAVRAGVGWIGKSTNLITKEFGSWVFLGEILLNIDLEYDTDTVADHCGSCTACLDACPTNAIVEPYVVNAQRCLSYVTIELRGPEIPNEIAGDMSGWLYGCDVCQDVCPWNRFEKPTGDARFEPRHAETSIDLDTLESMDHETYVGRFRRSAMKRPKLAGLKRNARALKANAE